MNSLRLKKCLPKFFYALNKTKRNISIFDCKCRLLTFGCNFSRRFLSPIIFLFSSNFIDFAFDFMTQET